MSDLTMLNRIADIATSYFIPMLLKSEDFDSFESNVIEESKKLWATHHELHESCYKRKTAMAKIPLHRRT